MRDIFINNRAKDQHSYDAIVVGSGMSGGWAAKELCEKGLKTLVLERGRDVKHVKDYPTATLHPWELTHRNMLTSEDLKTYPIQSKVYHFGEDNKHFFFKRYRARLRAGKTLSMEPRLSCWRQIATMVTPHFSLE